MQIDKNQSLKIFDRDTYPAAADTEDRPPQTIGYPSVQRPGCAALEVDHFAWPPLCRAIDDTAKAVAAPIVESILRASQVGKRIVLISGATRQSGRTTTAIWLAAACARINLRVALIDADIENPSIAHKLGVQPFAGWERFCNQDQPLDDYLIDSLADRYTILPCIVRSPLASWPAHWDLGAVFEGLRDHYDAILVDTLPLAREGIGSQMLDDCAPFVDAALWLDTGPIDTRWALQQFQAGGIHSLGLVQRAPYAAAAA